MSFDRDYQQGMNVEEEIKTLLETTHNIKLSKLSKYHSFDFVTHKGEVYLEIKSRNNEYEKFANTIISLSKVMFAKNNQGKKFYFIFCFTDGNKFIEYDEKTFDSFSITEIERRDRNKIERNKYVSIPIHFLKDIDELHL